MGLIHSLPDHTGHDEPSDDERHDNKPEPSPYRTIWHRDPEGRWSIYVDGPRFDTACPRYYGSACAHVGHAHIGIDWTGPASLRVTMDSPHLEWTIVANETRMLRVLNAASPRLPLWTWRSAALVRARELLARALLGMGAIRLSGPTPSGHIGILMPARMYLIDETTAELDGRDLGRPTRMRPNPQIGEVSLPARGVLAIGGAAWTILDHDEYRRTQAETRP